LTGIWCWRVWLLTASALSYLPAAEIEMDERLADERTNDVMVIGSEDAADAKLLVKTQ
jgi:hypothetical protein